MSRAFRIPENTGPPARKKRRLLPAAFIRTLERLGPCKPGALYDALGVHPRTGSRLLRRLRAEGLIAGDKAEIFLTIAADAYSRSATRQAASPTPRHSSRAQPRPTQQATAPAWTATHYVIDEYGRPRVVKR